jgi:hypothetical protein
MTTLTIHDLFQSFLSALNNPKESDLRQCWRAYHHYFATGVLIGPFDDPRLNVSLSKAFEETLNPARPIVLRSTLLCLLAGEVAKRGEGDLAEEVVNACWLSQPAFDKLLEQAGSAGIGDLPRYYPIYLRLMMLDESADDRGGDVGLAD